MATFDPQDWAATAADSELVPAGTRVGVLIENFAGDVVYLGIGTPAVVGSGVRLTVSRPVTLTGEDAKKAIRGICDTGESAAGGYQES